MNPYLMGHKKFYGPGADYTINTEKPFTIVTEFRDDGKGHLAGMYQYYYQDGKKIEQPEYGFGDGNAMTQETCTKIFKHYKDDDFFNDHGGMPQFSKAVERGMTMVLSFWDDMATDMDEQEARGFGGLAGGSTEADEEKRTRTRRSGRGRGEA